MSFALSGAKKGNVPVTAEHYADIPYDQSLISQPIPSSYLTPACLPYQTDVLSALHPGHTLIEEADIVAAATAAQWDSPDTTKMSGIESATGDSSFCKDPLLSSTRQTLVYKDDDDDDNDNPQESYVRLWGGHPSKTPVHQQQSSHEPPPIKKKAEHRENQPGYEVHERSSIPQTLARGLVYLPVKFWGFVKKKRSN